MATRIGVDCGGTFTDLVFYDAASAETLVSKVPSTPAALETGVLNAAASLGPHTLNSAQLFLHGTTVALNALLERKGAKVGLLTTKGFRDTLEIRRGDRAKLYDPMWKPPRPLVPRNLRRSIRERVRFDGTVELPLAESDVEDALELFAQEGVDCVAVVFLHSYVNPAHELAAEDMILRSGFTGHVSLSSRISGEFREYERASTTVIDAYIRPAVTDYLRRLSKTLDGHGFHGHLLVTRSGGGSLIFAEAEERPFETINSGPVAGTAGAVELCQQLKLSSAITADVGGTSFDTSLLVDGHPLTKYVGLVDDMPLQSPWIDVRSIGAGGGSIACVDGGGLLRVGPQSAGAVPGPACYDRGGTDPTVTDAAVALGMLGRNELAGGISINENLARTSLESIGNQLGLGIDTVARGIVTIALTHMAEAIRSVTVEQGHDPRSAALIAFGGAGPLFASELARELQISTIVIPRLPGNFSAWGLLGQDITRSAARTFVHPLTDSVLPAASALIGALFEGIRQRAVGSLADAGRESEHASMDIRYVGQEYTLTIPVALVNYHIVDDAATISTNFSKAYVDSFGYTLDDTVEIVTVRASSRIPLPRRAERWEAEAMPGLDNHKTTRQAYSFVLDRWVAFQLVERSRLRSGSTLRGPAIALEETSTTYIDADYSLKVDDTGAFILTHSE